MEEELLEEAQLNRTVLVLSTLAALIGGSSYHGKQDSSLRTLVQPKVSQAASSAAASLRATHYGDSYNNSPLGCAGAGYYSSSDSSIAAVGYPYASEWPCGTALQLDNPTTGATLIVIRKDTCPGCGSTLIDLSEAGITQICGGLGSCQITVTKLSD